MSDTFTAVELDDHQANEERRRCVSVLGTLIEYASTRGNAAASAALSVARRYLATGATAEQAAVEIDAAIAAAGPGPMLQIPVPWKLYLDLLAAKMFKKTYAALTSSEVFEVLQDARRRPEGNFGEAIILIAPTSWVQKTADGQYRANLSFDDDNRVTAKPAPTAPFIPGLPA